MALKTLQPSLTTPLQTACESMTLLNTTSDGASKCAELFVTNNADKWTFFCVHCEKSTSDIGVFICHIRLEHLNCLIDKQCSGHSGNIMAPKTNNFSKPQKSVSEETREFLEATNRRKDEHQLKQSDVSIVNEQTIDIQSNASEVPNISDISLQPLESKENQNQRHIIKQEVITDEQPLIFKKTENLLTARREEYLSSNGTSLRQSPEMVNLPSPGHGELAADAQQQMQCDAIKEEIIINEPVGLQHHVSKVPKISEVTSLRQTTTSKELESIPNKETSSAISQQLETNQEYFAITAIGQDLEQQERNEIVQVFYINDEKNDISINRENSNDGDNNENNIEDIRPTDDVDMSSFLRKDDNDVNDTNLKLKCSYCQEIFKNMQILYAHISQHHETNVRLKTPYKCTKCDKSFKYKGILEKHNLAKHKGQLLQCPVCQVKRSKWCFLAHVQTHESDTCFPCQVCGKIFANNQERMKHWKKHAVEKPYPCKICFQRFRKPQYLRRHTKGHPRYQCSVCSTLFNSMQSQNAPYICGKCKDLSENLVVELDPLVTNTEDVMKDHFDNTETITNDNDAIFINDGQDSDIEFIDESYTDNVPSVSSSNTAQTPRNDDSNSQHKCLYCNREFMTERRLIIHTTKMHDKSERLLSRFICRYCNRSFQTRSGLALHHKTHDKSNQFRCPVCPLTEFRESSFITHVLMHESDTCFPCQVCAKLFTSNSERLQHWRIHIEERPHGCNHCYRRFYQKNVLKNHMKSHGLYYCHFCHKNFQSDRTIKTPYVCGECEKSPYVKNQLKRRKSKVKRRAIDSEEE
ncbi:zinc finger protein 699-like [Lucilia sericata]|uniref:zinc finger protein 699-like n=1 Tax=Lucilia sericata TaxID=13632 RepID=UPI0018A86A3D|nr:zinc finger protein 699-like [Lucilia sericata]